VEARLSPVALLTIVIEALEITAPVGSVTVPTIVPVGVCASRDAAARNGVSNRGFMTRNQRKENQAQAGSFV
jgi:hypothetical protein